MDVDEDEDGTQQVKKVPDYGIEVDFEGLDDEERQVNFTASMLMQEPYFA
jgi:structural maintenance of chromosome 1